MRIAALALALSALLAMGFAAPPPVLAGCVTANVAVATAIQSDTTADGDGGFAKVGNTSFVALADTREITPTIIPAAASPPIMATLRAYILMNSTPTTREAGLANNHYIDMVVSDADARRLDAIVLKLMGHPLRL